MIQDWSSFWYGVASVPLTLALAFLALRSLLRAYGLVYARGWFVEFGGEAGVSDRHRDMRRRAPFLWTGVYRQHRGDAPFTSRFITVATSKHGITFGRKHFEEIL